MNGISMSKATPAALRLAAILKLFASDPTRSWTLTEMVDVLGISRSTCHSFLVGLDRVDLIYRDKDRRYRLGSLAAEVGHAASHGGLVAAMIKQELETLSHRLGVIAVTNYRRKGAILIRDWIDPVRKNSIESWAGATIPLSPPWGAIFYAWEPPSEQRRWLTGKDCNANDAALIEHIEESLSATRRQSYLCGIHSDRPCMEGLDMRWKWRQLYTDHFRNNISSNERYSLDFLAAPVFDYRDQVSFAVSLTGFGVRLKGDEVRFVAEQLRASCMKMSDFLQKRDNASSVGLS